jgi:tryptophan halogenase
MVMAGAYKLLEHFPNTSFAQSNIDSYNTELIQEIERIRDFIVLHYLTGRTDTPHWAYCQNMKLPDSLAQRIELYKHTGRIRCKPGELFTDLSWFYIFDGIGMSPESHDPLMDVVNMNQFREILGAIANDTALASRSVPSHDSYFSADVPIR